MKPVPQRLLWLQLLLGGVLFALLGLGLNRLAPTLFQHVQEPVRLLLSLLWVLLGSLLVRRAGADLRRIGRTRPPEEGPFWNVLGISATVIGLYFVALILWPILGFNPSSLLLGGAVTGVLVGLAAQATLGNLFAGLLLLVLRPYQVGDFITSRTWMFGGIEYTGRVEEISLFYTFLREKGSRRVIPNSAMAISTIRKDPERAIARLPIVLPLALSPRALQEELTHAFPTVSLLATGVDDKSYQAELRVPEEVPPEQVLEWVIHRVSQIFSAN